MKSTDASRYVWTLTEVFYVIVMKISSWLMIRSAVYLSNLLSRTTKRFRRLVSYIRGPNNWVSWRTDDHGFLSANKVKTSCLAKWRNGDWKTLLKYLYVRTPEQKWPNNRCQKHCRSDTKFNVWRSVMNCYIKLREICS